MYYSFNDYCKETFGCKVYKLSIDAGFTCPNRDGTLGFKGCIFCADGSGDFAVKGKSVTEQLQRAKTLVENKNKGGKYLAYFQSFTNTYAPTETLRKLYFEAIASSDIVGISIATRPDCLSDEVLALLSEVNKVKPVFVELGLQTIHQKTADYIRRGYPLSVFDEAVKKLKKIGVNVIVHTIIGLPFETKEMAIETARYVGKSGADGIKLQLLQILDGTDLAVDFKNGVFKELSLEEYIETLANCIEVLPENMVIHRLTGDGAKKRLIAPLFSGDKKNVLNSINRYFKTNDIKQGKKS